MPAQPRKLRIIVPSAAVVARIDELALEVVRDFAGGRPLFVVIAEGARRFSTALAEAAGRRGLLRDELIVRARRTAGQVLRPVELEAFNEASVRGRDVLVLDDIADEGHTLAAVLSRVKAAGPLRLRVGVLVSKRERRRVQVALDYVGFDVEEGWVVGFGMDLDGELRELDHLAVVEPDEPYRCE